MWPFNLWGKTEEPPKRRPMAPPDYAKPTLFIHTFDKKTSPRPQVDLELDVSTDPLEAAQDGSSASEDLAELLPKAVRLINKRLLKLAEQWEYDRQLSLDMAGGEDDFYGDETTGGRVMRSTIDVAGGSAPKLRVGCMCESGSRRSVEFGEMLSKHEWPQGWVVKLRHKGLQKGLTQSIRSDNSSILTADTGSTQKTGDFERAVNEGLTGYAR